MISAVSGRKFEIRSRPFLLPRDEPLLQQRPRPLFPLSLTLLKKPDMRNKAPETPDEHNAKLLNGPEGDFLIRTENPT